MKKVIILLLITISVSAQKTINNYKYIIVPKQFKTFKGEDKYQANSLVKFLFDKNKFTTLFDDETLPLDLAQNQCLGLTVKLLDDSGMFTTKTRLGLKDCFNKIIFTTKVGKSKIKEYKRAYHEAIRESFQSIKNLNYSYIPLSNENMNVSVERSKKYELKKKKSTTNTAQVSTIKNNKLEKGNNIKMLYAQSTEFGFQLIDQEPKVVFKILKTEYPNLYIIKDKNGMLIKKENDFWEAQYYLNNKLITESYKVKF